MMDVDSLTDAELRTKLIEFGFPVMPITGTTRKVMAKKLRLLMENKNKINSEGRRSLARYSSEEESDSDSKSTKRDKRRATMAAPPTKVPVRKSVRKIDITIESERPPPQLIEEKKITTRTSKITKITENNFDTGSDSESEVAESAYNSSINNHDYKSSSSVSPIVSSSYLDTSRKYSPPKSVETSIGRTTSYTNQSPGRYTSFGSPMSSGDSAADRLNQIRSRLSLGNTSYDKPLYPMTATTDQEEEKVETPFLSNFTRRLSQLRDTGNSPKVDYDYKNDIIKEHDTNGSGTYSSRTYLSRPVRRDFVRNYQGGKESGFKNSMLPYAMIILAFLFFVVLGILYMGMHSGQTAVDQLSAGLVIPYCDKSNPASIKGVNCILDTDLQGAVDMYKVLKPELLKRAVTHRCSDSGVKPYMSEHDIVTFVRNYYGLKEPYEIQENLYNMEVLTFANPKWEISLTQSEDGGTFNDIPLDSMDQVVNGRKLKTITLSVLYPELPWKCSLYNKLTTIFQTILVLGGCSLALYFSQMGYKHFKHYRQKQREELFYMIERIVDTLQSNTTEDADSFLVINHVRDMILPLNDRKRMERTWQKAVQFINENESRVRTEVQVVQGEPYEVWRWLGSPSLNTSGSPRSKSWQGQAFETQVGSVNSLPCSPTPCLKIRGMVDEGDRNLITIKEAVLSKCAHQCRILHCAVDTTSKCVYLKCADQNDAAVAYRNLHGWWYAGNLVTVKYLRLERYMQRYPDSPISGPPYLKALQPATDWTN